MDGSLADKSQFRLPSNLPALWPAERVGLPYFLHFRSAFPGQVINMILRKLVTTIVSTFTAHYIYQWSTYFPSTPLQPLFLPSFDGRAVLYPSNRELRDYMKWRQVDCKLCILILGCARIR